MSYSGKFKDKNNNLHPVTSVLYGTCDTAAGTAAKVVTCADFDTLMTGVTIRVKFTYGNTAANPTININSTGAKSVFRFGSTTPVGAGSWEAGAVVELTYDGTSFFMTNSDNIAAKQNVTDNTLQTTDKTVPGAINELKSGLTELTANDVSGYDDITASTHETSYVCPTDGYLYASSESDTTGVIRVVIMDSSASYAVGFIYMNVADEYQIQTLYLKKGFKVYVSSRTANTVVRFNKLGS